MSEYLFLYRGGERATAPNEWQKQMQKWGIWLADLGKKGVVKDAGQPLDRAGKVVSGKHKTASDGPYAAQDIVSGHSLMEGTDRAQAVELSLDCPIFETGGSVEVRAVTKM